MSKSKEQKVQQPLSDKPRIGWVDLAKGICITLVVFHHVASVMKISYPLDVQLRAFRMPLYFILSGLFFKQYEGFVGFLKRKINKLLIPFLFFFVTTVVIPYWVLIGSDIRRFYAYPIKYMYRTRLVMLNEPIWFLLCLFEVNILFYGVQWLAGWISSRYKTALVLVCSLVIGFAGLLMGMNHLSIPFYVDTAMSALPLFAFGWWLFRHTHFLTAAVQPVRDIALLLICVLVLWFLAVPVSWVGNEFSRQSIGVVYLCGISGTMMVLILSKFIGRLGIVSYWGRYSIMILCTHFLVATALLFALNRFGLDKNILLLVVFVLTMLICHLLIPFMLRFLPYVTAQKDLIKAP